MKTQKLWLAFVGQNATTGRPHPITGWYSRYGDIKKFRSQKDRDDFVSNYYNHNNTSEFAKATNKKEAKSKYCAGVTQQFFDEMLNSLDFTDIE